MTPHAIRESAKLVATEDNVLALLAANGDRITWLEPPAAAPTP